MIKAQGTFEMGDWKEETTHEVEGVKHNLAHATMKIHGPIEGDMTMDSLIVYGLDSLATFVGMQRVVGTVDGRDGSFMVQFEGTAVGHDTTSRWTVIPGCGTGALTGLRGTGGFEPSKEQPFPYNFEYEFVDEAVK